MPYNQEKIDRDLREHDSSESDMQKKVVELCLNYVKTSSDEMSDLYARWDNNDFIYRGYRGTDKDDKESIAKGEPPKIIVPITYAQIQTALSFIFSSFNQKPVFFELIANGPEDSKGVEALETDLDYQMNHQKIMLKLYCYLLDVFKNGFGVMKCDWTEKYCKMRTGRQQPKPLDIMASIAKMFGGGMQQQVETVEQVEDVLEYQGNRLSNISPYSFYPDTSVTIAKFQEGKFVAHDEETSMSEMTAREGDDFHGTDKIPDTIPTEDMRNRNRRTGAIFKNPISSASAAPGPGQGGSPKPRVCVKLEVEFVMSERDASKEFSFDLGNGDYPVKWLAVIGNDKKLVMLKQTGYLHNLFNYNISEFSPDNSAFFNPGLSDTIGELQNLITFFLNSHVINVKKIIQNRFVADPSKVFVEDITSNAALIRLKQAGLPIDRIIQQLQVTDVTRGHVADISTLTSIVQMITGVNENALGQYSQGRRSATEARSVNAGAAARLKMHAQLIWIQGLEPMGRQILSNTRQGRTEEVYNRIVGNLALAAPYNTTILADPNSLAGGYDFSPFDATLPSDKAFQANIFQQLFTEVINNPNSMQLLNINPVKLLNHIAELYGIKNMADFSMQATPALPPLQASVQPNAQVGEQVAAGTAQPVPDASSLIQSLSQG